jgi:hypothetical protein
MVEEMHQLLLTAEALNPQCKVLDSRRRCLPMHEIAISESVNKQRNHRIDVRERCRTDILEHEREGLEHTVLDI